MHQRFYKLLLFSGEVNFSVCEFKLIVATQMVESFLNLGITKTELHNTITYVSPVDYYDDNFVNGSLEKHILLENIDQEKYPMFFISHRYVRIFTEMENLQLHSIQDWFMFYTQFSVQYLVGILLLLNKVWIQIFLSLLLRIGTNNTRNLHTTRTRQPRHR